MGKLYLECLDRKLKIKKLAEAVYTALKQTALIKAEIVFSDADRIQSLNKNTRGVDSVTDVLSYPTLEGIKGERLNPKNCPTEMDGKYIFIGSIVLCEEKIKSQAKELGHSEVEERNYLIIHGLMHLFGYDHMEEKDKEEMRKKEKEALLIMNKNKRAKEQKGIEKSEKKKTTQAIKELNAKRKAKAKE